MDLEEQPNNDNTHRKSVHEFFGAIALTTEGGPEVGAQAASYRTQFKNMAV